MTGDKALLQFPSFIQNCLKTEPKKVQAFMPRKQKLDGFFLKELTGICLHSDLYMILPLIFTISHGKLAWKKDLIEANIF